MALQVHKFVFLLIIVGLSYSSLLCCGRNIHGYTDDPIIIRRGLRAVNQKTFNVDDYGAQGDGSADDTKAFEKAWKEACSSSGAVFLVPGNKNYVLKPITFSGPCNSPINIQISGNILAWEDRSAYDSRHWLVFKKINNIRVQGGGVIDGNGKIWWQNSCKVDKTKPCKSAPTALVFNDCENLVVNNLNIQNAQQMHLSFNGCNLVKASGLTITSPEDSPNTDGIHITSTKNIQVTSSSIGTGDDCISIETGSQSVRAMDITCGPGHGISIGSLGDKESKAHVSDITVNGANLTKTTNGVRIKTWQGGSGVASNIIFQNIHFSDVKNPIIIDQQYCDQDTPCKKQASAVQIRNVLYQNITGTSVSKNAVVFDCSETHPCQGITMQNVEIESSEGDETAQARCDNVKLSKIEDVSPHC
ncbi:hypothetical protein BVRB_006470 [Beta vulgaris subsp. vulgaris]|uniref:endo-polygalacturonase n=1 Tax=Beta vulgaris subsp. vulgaris TaxID=3555 RepID=A0A0J8B3S4_BETVV|nr:polygalacturonase [Beta vulgaris subsp. vulgaris]KMS95636.1 hypothetical protein BVRB_006470 [Beta vulgaris subsp. vulgaris]